jgi:hypothetical protein
MKKIIADKIKTLPNNTHLFYGHEYSKDNLQFMNYIDPSHEYIKQNYLDSIEK